MSAMHPHLPEAFIRGTGHTPFVPAHRASTTTPELLFAAASAALNDAGLSFTDVDGLGIASFTSAPDHSIDFAVRWNIRARWLMDSALGGASGNDLLHHATAALATNSASTILLVAGDHFGTEDFGHLVRNYNSSATRDFPDMSAAGPNAFFAMLTAMQIREFGLTREDYGRIVTSQRQFASENVHAAYRDPLSLEDYLKAPMVAEPLGRYDCVPVVSGAVAVVVSSIPGPVRVLDVQAHHNIDGQDGTGLVTGMADVAPRLWHATERSPIDVDVVSIYDDYPVMVVAQLLDCGFLDRSRVGNSLRALLDTGRPALNSSGGQLSAGQPGAGAGLQGLVDVANALRDRGPKSTHGSRLGLVTGYGMVTYRYGSCANAALLERV